MCCSRLAANTGRKKSPKIAIWAPSHNYVGLYLSNYGTYRQLEKKLVKQQYLLYMSPQYGELRPTSGWDRFISLGTPANFNGFRVLAALLHGTLVVSISQTAAFNRGRHLYLAGRPSRWALAHISSMDISYTIMVVALSGIVAQQVWHWTDLEVTTLMSGCFALK